MALFSLAGEGDLEGDILPRVGLGGVALPLLLTLLARIDKLIKWNKSQPICFHLIGMFRFIYTTIFQSSKSELSTSFESEKFGCFDIWNKLIVTSLCILLLSGFIFGFYLILEAPSRIVEFELFSTNYTKTLNIPQNLLTFHRETPYNIIFIKIIFSYFSKSPPIFPPTSLDPSAI